MLQVLLLLGPIGNLQISLMLDIQTLSNVVSLVLLTDDVRHVLTVSLHLHAEALTFIAGELLHGLYPLVLVDQGRPR